MFSKTLMAGIESSKELKMAESTLYKTALSKAMAICSKREYCLEDLRIRLRSWDICEADMEKILKILSKENFINESRYSQAYAKDKFLYNKWGKVKISAHLKAKKIPSDKIVTALNSIDNEIYRSKAKEIILTHSRGIKAKNQYDLKGKLLRYGLSKGFESTLLYEILNDPDQE
jgi:regulatory protein